MAVDVRNVLKEKPGNFTAYFLPLLVLAQDNDKIIDVLEVFGLDRLLEAVERLGEAGSNSRPGRVLTN